MGSIKKSKIKNQRSKQQRKNKNKKGLINQAPTSTFIIFGTSIFVLGLIILFLTFLPVIKEELKFVFHKGSGNPTPTKLIPVDSEYGIVIPKISANAKIIDNVDPFNEPAYQQALTKGVAHAKGTANPGQVGNAFIFAHSSANWFTANQYNSVFYLINKLENKDNIEIYYKGKKFTYQVFEKEIVEADQIEYINPIIKGSGNPTPTSILTLMTCWPAGTNLKRLIIRARIKNF